MYLKISMLTALLFIGCVPTKQKGKLKFDKLNSPSSILFQSPVDRTFTGPINNVTLNVVTEENSECRYSDNKKELFKNMRLFTRTGLKDHSDYVSVSGPGSYYYYVECKNFKTSSSFKTKLNFKIKGLPAESSDPSDGNDVSDEIINIRKNVRQVFNSSCIDCHGDGKIYERFANLSLPIKELESNKSLVKPMSTDRSMLYQKVSTGSMRKYIRSNQDLEYIRQWIMSIEPPKQNTTPPVILSYSPNGNRFNVSTTSVNLNIVTDRVATCGYSLKDEDKFSSMKEFDSGGVKNHLHKINNLKPGSHKFYVRCVDSYNNLSLSKLVNFSIKDLPNNPSVSMDQVRKNVRQVLNNNCIACHAPNQNYGSVIDLTVDVKVLEKNSFIIKPKKPNDSYLFNKISSGSMAKYITSSSERSAIREWIERIDPSEVLSVSCKQGEAVLDNVCVKVGKTLRSYGYRMITPDELYSDISRIFRVSLSRVDPESGQLILPTPQAIHGFDNQFGLVSANPLFVSAMEQVANMLGTALEKKSDFIGKTVSNSCMTYSKEKCGMILVKKYIPIFFTRVLSTEEMDVYRDFFKNSTDDKKQTYINFFKALVQSPSFIFREEHGQSPDPTYKLNGFEVASRLSYFITGHSPDAQLRSKAINGTILNKAVREETARRLLSYQSSKDHLTKIFLESLGIKKLVHSEELSKDMKEETRRVIQDIFFAPDKKWTDIFTTNYTYINKRLSEIYKIKINTDNSTFIKVNYPNKQRSGILSHASYLSAFYDGKSLVKTNDIRRGINFYEKILCKSMPLPPPDVDIDLDPADSLEGCRLHTRKASTWNPAGACFQCHQHFDPIGAGFERFNNLGEYRTVQEDDPSCSTIEKFYVTGGKSFDTIGEFTKSVATNPRVGRCLALNMKSYAYGSDAPTPFLESIFLEMSKFKKSLNFVDLVVDIVTSNQFIERELKDEE